MKIHTLLFLLTLKTVLCDSIDHLAQDLLTETQN